jgi:hypothetical protein
VVLIHVMLWASAKHAHNADIWPTTNWQKG